MLILHHLDNSRSFRILWLLEELNIHYGLNYRVQKYQRNRHHLAPNEMIKIHPMGKAPILVDENLPIGEQALAESALIIEYLLKFYDTERIFAPSDDFTSWKDYQFWLHFAEGSLMPPLVMRLILKKSVEKSPFFVRPIIKQVKSGIENLLLIGNINKSLQLLEQHLSNKTWLCDEKLTGADIQLYFAVASARYSQADLQGLANIQAWLQRCESRPAFQKLLEQGDGLFQ